MVGMWWMLWTACAPGGVDVLSQTWVPAPEVHAVADVNLEQSDGQRLSAAWFAGHTTVVVFGYTSCPDVCPTTLTGMARALDGLHAGGHDVRGLFIAVDPERDAPVLSAYVAHFSDHIIGATGSPAQLQTAANALGGSFTVQRTPDGVTVDHATSAFIVDSNARIVGYQLRPSDGEALASDVAAWLQTDGPRLVVEDGRVRQPIPDIAVTAGYGVLHNRSPQPLRVADVMSPVADRVEVHETVRQAGMAGMRATSLAIEADGAVTFAPGGLHWMLTSLSPGAVSVPIRLTLDDGDALWLRLPVERAAVSP